MLFGPPRVAAIRPSLGLRLMPMSIARFRYFFHFLDHFDSVVAGFKPPALESKQVSAKFVYIFFQVLPPTCLQQLAEPQRERDEEK